MGMGLFDSRYTRGREGIQRNDHMSGKAENPGARKALDEIVSRAADPDFVTRHRRVPEISKTGAHVNPEILAMVPPRSRYVHQWRKHARHCLECANVYRYFGLSLD
jgi:hypothetical protein